MPHSPRSPAQLLADIALFAPLGLAASIVEAMPVLASKGRARLLPRVSLARTVGQFAVDEGYRRLAAMTGRLDPSVRDVVGAALGLVHGPLGGASRQGSGGQGDVRRTPEAAEDGRRAHGEAGGDRRHGQGTGLVDAPGASELAIASYDSLSAPQVVKLLAGLSREEIEAVRRYEAATRGRRTILARAEQLLA